MNNANRCYGNTKSTYLVFLPVSGCPPGSASGAHSPRGASCGEWGQGGHQWSLCPHLSDHEGRHK